MSLSSEYYSVIRIQNISNLLTSSNHFQIRRISRARAQRSVTWFGGRAAGGAIGANVARHAWGESWRSWRVASIQSVFNELALCSVRSLVSFSFASSHARKEREREREREVERKKEVAAEKRHRTKVPSFFFTAYEDPRQDGGRQSRERHQ